MQKGQIVKISGRWYVRYWEKRNVHGSILQKRVSHCLGPVTTRGKKPPADIADAAEEHMASIGATKIPAERITTVGEFVTGVYFPWVDKHMRPSTAKGYKGYWKDHLHPL